MPDVPPAPKAVPPPVAAALVARADALFGAQDPAWIGGLVKRFSASWVGAALVRAEAKARLGLPVTTGYVLAVLEGFKREGAPPANLLSGNPAGLPQISDEEFTARLKEQMAKSKAQGFR